jgi:hypothetical protein
MVGRMLYVMRGPGYLRRYAPCILNMNRNKEIEERITLKVTEGLNLLKPHLQSWARDHLIQPHQIRLSTNPEGSSFKDFWLVTDHVGKEDSSYRIVYDDEGQAFGLEVTLDTGVEWHMGELWLVF